MSFYAGITEFFFNLMMIKTVIYSMKGAVKKKVQKVAKLKMISMLIASISLEIFAGILYVGAGQIVEIKAIATIPTFVHLIISTMLLEMLNNISQMVKETSKRQSIQTSTEILSSKNTNLIADSQLNWADEINIPAKHFGYFDNSS
ncbi:hypothetical protein HK099_006119 [Clydaea vesicula]|uniref:Uncharacterized protein n=1 Tax=Clydaea vesicula TaxID=447962 RepID=A0AAD5TYB3_9FUNG|nr:hypothetical protein HK099_006119 [Clydaea vesicula]